MPPQENPARDPLRNRKRNQINSRKKSQNCAGVRVGTAVLRRTGGRASRLAAYAWLLPRVQGCCMPVSSAIFFCFAFLDTQGFPGPLVFLKIALEVFLYIKTQGFLLKARQKIF